MFPQVALVHRKGLFVGSFILLALLMSAVMVTAQGPQPQATQAALGPGFTYQGQLKNGTAPYNGSCNMQFSLWDAQGSGSPPSGGTQVGGTHGIPSVNVSNGLFTVVVNNAGQFGASAFDGNARWLQVSVQCGSDSGYTTLSRQALTAAPYALGNWGLKGNGGTSAGNFLGTTDNFSLTLRVSNTAALRLLPNPNAPIVIGGYSGNQVSGLADGATIGGGGSSVFGANVISGTNVTFSTIGGGAGNRIIGSANRATIGGGAFNRGSGDFSTIGGGSSNTASGFSTVGGGAVNKASGGWSTVSGGADNMASADFATVGGGYSNTATLDYSTVSGGQSNMAIGLYSTVGGGDHNTTSGYAATVGGGVGNTASGFGAFVGGGGYDGLFNYGNQASGTASTVGGGMGNTASANYSTVGGGDNNKASNYAATVSGGEANTASGGASTVSGGGSNTSSADYSTVGGGVFNTASGHGSTVPGGVGNIAHGAYSFAAGWNVRALHDGAFVWADTANLAGTPITSTAPDQFIVRASGGITLYTNVSATIGAVLAPGSSTWGTVSDRNAKMNFSEVDGRAVLEALASIPLETWSYKTQDASIRHIGPMAQEFHAAFGVGENDTTISTVDGQGVALAAIQGLYQVVQAQDARIAALEARLNALKQQHIGSATTK